ncbi:MAG: bifunctional demethylmenaquinone methyltransferase/2-methoxy-6-polyprenyl-1,4-benzoquinol methylase UbiE [bacterium]|nr:bifunctional demethylmenaquinone methyltransferase/2-methoxy-6-polyprenyl-1,4-benzoquinol methylase UbiE [bacterium]
MSEPGISGSPAVRRMFSSIAGQYDLLNRLFSLGTDVRWRRELVSEIPAGDGHPVLDLAAGTADVALTLEKERPGRRLIVGADFTLPMLKIGARKLERRRSERIRLTAGDAYALPFGEETFEAVTIAFGLRNLSSRVDALREMARVLRPGGRVVILEFSPLDRPLIGPLFNFYFHRVMPLLGGIISGDQGAYRYLPRSVDAFPNPFELGREMLEAGLVNIRYRPLTFGIACIHAGEKQETKAGRQKSD